MSKYAYIDESGTNDDETVMTVAMVILEGSRSAEKLRSGILKSLFGKLRKIHYREQLRERELHYADMTKLHRSVTGDYLSSANVICYISHYWHTESPKNHKARFAIYTELVKNCINNAFQIHPTLSVVIAKQGGWQTYKQSFLAELRPIPEAFIKSGKYRKSKFDLASSAHAGIQLADFYAGACRDFLRSGQHIELASAYEIIKHQILKIDNVPE